MLFFFKMLPTHVSDPKHLHYLLDIIAQCVRWYLVYALSLHNLEEMMADFSSETVIYPRFFIQIIQLLGQLP